MKDRIRTFYDEGDPVGGVQDPPVTDPPATTDPPPVDWEARHRETDGRLQKANQAIVNLRTATEAQSAGQWTVDDEGQYVPGPNYTDAATTQTQPAPVEEEIPDPTYDPQGYAQWVRQQAANDVKAIVGEAMGSIMPVVNSLGTQNIKQSIPDWGEIGGEVEAMCKGQEFRSALDAQTRNPQFFEIAVTAARAKKAPSVPAVPGVPGVDPQEYVSVGGGGGGHTSTESGWEGATADEVAYGKSIGMKSYADLVKAINDPVKVG